MVSIVRAVEGVEGIPAGFPILLDRDMAIVESAFRYLLDLAVVPGRSHAADTLRTYAEHLYDWFDTLEQSLLDWRMANEGTIAAYRNRMFSAPSPHTGRPYARSTINDRVRTICRFYVWAHRHRLVAELPFGYVDVSVRSSRPRGMLAHLDRRPAIVSANVLTIAEAEALPRPLRVDQLRRLFAALDPPYGLIAQWALATGMRRKELCGLQLAQVPVVAHLDVERNPLVGLPLTVTKGDRPRTAYPPLRLIDRTHWYIGEERAALVKRVRHARPEYRPPTMLFLNGGGAPVTRSRLSATFSTAFRRAGLEGSGHWLRHTFAMTMLVRLQRQAARSPDLNPLKIVQVLLGHASIQSTAVYLRCVEVHSEALVDSLAYLYGEVIGDDCP
ncbi:transposase (plasmid) [Bradyrhizobium sp. SK17]|jgi:site-specific recombinase XerD|uniref:tyrosine-type recombinase/integrase n=1 Tax=Bradyrhizobium sp. SK17 TaxID=2057741 RepID=UPI000C317F6B|nr:tyrosine-type recombinase/integrase [Bradyrhizobium sp. SK17]AUD00315.1 transposase [Bradyrhizobium sp. SK17]MBN8937646.1 tyrosine-type recombinase/integrase [Hyphomicrobiales bacterium]